MPLIREAANKQELVFRAKACCCTSVEVEEKPGRHQRIDSVAATITDPAGGIKEELFKTDLNVNPATKQEAFEKKTETTKKENPKTEVLEKKRETTKKDEAIEERRRSLEREMETIQGKLSNSIKYNDSLNAHRYLKQLSDLNRQYTALGNKDSHFTCSVPMNTQLVSAKQNSPLALLKADNANEYSYNADVYPRGATVVTGSPFQGGAKTLLPPSFFPLGIDGNHVEGKGGNVGYPNRYEETRTKHIPSPSAPTRRQAESMIKGAVENSVERYKLTPKESAELEKYAKAVAVKESSMNPNVKAGDHGQSHGMFQINSPAHPDYNVAKGYKEPNYNTQYGVNFLASLYKRYGSWEKAVERYNGSGPMAVAYRNDVLSIARRV